MPLGFVRKGSLDMGPQRSLFDQTVAGRSFERSAHRISANPRNPRLLMTDDVLRRRLADLDLKRRRAQIRARKALDAAEPAPLELPFAV